MKRWWPFVMWPDKAETQTSTRTRRGASRLLLGVFVASVFVTLAASFLALRPEQASAIPAPPSDSSGYYRVNALTIYYEGTYYYYDGSAGPDYDIGGGTVDTSSTAMKTTGAVFKALGEDSSSYCGDDIFHNPQGGWARVYSTMDAGVCTKPTEIALGSAPANDQAARKIAFFKDSDGDIESVRITNATPFVQVTNPFDTSDQTTVYMEQKQATDCPNILVYYKDTGNLGYYAPKKGTPSASDASSTYRSILKAFTGADSGNCIVGSGDNSQNSAKSIFDVSVFTMSSDSIGLGNMKGVVKQLDTAVVGDIGDAGPAGDRTTASQELSQVPGAPKADSSDDTNDPCSGITTTALRWIACPLVEAGAKAVDAMNGTIQNFLFTSPNEIFTQNFETAWAVFRNLGVALILIAGLVMVVSQAAGMEIFDAYTVRKVLPRLLIAAIGITLSWELLRFVLIFFNDLGVWANDLILAPFANIKDSTATSQLVGASFSWGALLLGGSSVIISLGIPGLLSLLGTVVLALLIGLLVLTIRQMVILVCILLAPLAIAAYILPGTQKLWKFWKDALITSLVMFPIIMAFLAAGQALSKITAASSNKSLNVLSIIAYFAPYFLLPFAFKLAGGLMSTVFSIANDRSRGMFDKAKKKREEIRGDRRTRASQNQLWDRDNKFVKKFRLNEGASWRTDPTGNAAFALREKNIPMLSKRGRRIEAALDAARTDQSQKWVEHVNKEGANDKFYAAVGGMYDGFDNKTKRMLMENGWATGEYARNEDGSFKMKDGERVVSSITANRSIRSEKDHNDMATLLESAGGDSNVKAAMALRSTAAYTSSMHLDGEMGRANTAVGAALGRAVHGFLAPDDSAASENLLMKEFMAGGATEEAAQAAAHTATVNAQAAGSRSNPDNKPGYGTEWDATQKKWVTSHNGNRAWRVVDTINPGDYSQAKGGVFDPERMGGLFQQVLDIDKGDATRIEEIKKEWRAAGADEKEIDFRLNKAKESVRTVKDTLFTVAGPYSQASPDAKQKALRMIEGSQYKKQFEDYSRSEFDADPTQRGGPPPPPAGAPGSPGAPPPITPSFPAPGNF